MAGNRWRQGVRLIGFLSMIAGVFSLIGCGSEPSGVSSSGAAAQVTAAASSVAASDPRPGSGNGTRSVLEPKVHYQRGHGKNDHGRSPLMSWHGGTVLVADTTAAIFWGSQWNDSAFAGDKIVGIDAFFDGFGGSGYADDSTEYYGSNGPVTNSSSYLGHVIDSSKPPGKALSVSAAVAEVCKITNNSPDPDGAYFIYTATGAGHVNYCAWHSYGSCSNGAPVQVAYMPNIDGISGCDPEDAWTDHSQGLAALANVTAHELSEMITDPRNGGWYDSQGQENGDKCSWAFHNPVTLSNGSVWKLQMEWSNAAYTAGTGYLNLQGQAGCLQ
jgi:hypothetical protein